MYLVTDVSLTTKHRPVVVVLGCPLYNMLMPEKEDQVPEPAADTPEASWSYQVDDQGGSTDNSATIISPDVDPVSWTGDEFIAHKKTTQWYTAVAAGTAGITALVYLLTKDLVAAGVVVVVAVVFAVFASRKPRQLDYSIDESGVHIGSRLYPYNGFKSFSLVEEEAAQAIWLMPLKRFMPIITVYFDMKDGQKIVDALSRVLPLEDRQPDIVDHLMHRLKF